MTERIHSLRFQPTTKMPARFERKWIERAALAAMRTTLPAPVVFTNGVFDIVHRGHVSYLDAARALGACLIVGINSDASVRTLNKGTADVPRPIHGEADRMALIAALECVDWVVCFNESTPMALIEALRPDVLVKGGDYDMATLPETARVKRWGGCAVSIPFEYPRSTTALLRRIRAHTA